MAHIKTAVRLFPRSHIVRSSLRATQVYNRALSNTLFVPHTPISWDARRSFCTKPEGGDQPPTPPPDDSEGASTVSINTNASMIAIFTCNACQSRHSYQFSKQSYNQGVVIVRCPSCDNLHLVADNLGWFSDEKRNLEIISKEKGIRMEKKTGTLSEALRSMGFSEEDATIVSKKRGNRISLSERVIQALPHDHPEGEGIPSEDSGPSNPKE